MAHYYNLYQHSQNRKIFTTFASFFISLTCYASSVCDTELDVVFVVDGSETVVTEGLVSWYDVMDFMIGIVDRFKVNTEKMNVGFVRYDEVAENRFYLNTDFTRNGVQKKINDLVHDHRGGVTNTAAGKYHKTLNMLVVVT